MKKEFLDLGSQPIANKFLKEDEFKDEFFFDLKVVFDEDTKLVSLKDFVQPELMFNADYAYNTSLSTPMVDHFKSVAGMLTEEFRSVNVMEIGSNDGTFLNNFKNGNLEYVGFEPSSNVAKIANQNKIKTLNQFFGMGSLNSVKNF